MTSKINVAKREGYWSWHCPCCKTGGPNIKGDTAWQVAMVSAGWHIDTHKIAKGILKNVQ